MAKQGGKYDGVLKEYNLQSLVISDYDKIYDTFIAAMSMDLQSIAADAQNRANNLFDEIFIEMERSDWTYSEGYASIIEQVYEDDIAYYRGRPIDKLKRLICTVTRSNSTLYSMQERLSSWKRK